MELKGVSVIYFTIPAFFAKSTPTRMSFMVDSFSPLTGGDTASLTLDAVR